MLLTCRFRPVFKPGFQLFRFDPVERSPATHGVPGNRPCIQWQRYPPEKRPHLRLRKVRRIPQLLLYMSGVVPMSTQSEQGGEDVERLLRSRKTVRLNRAYELIHFFLRQHRIRDRGAKLAADLDWNGIGGPSGCAFSLCQYLSSFCRNTASRSFQGSKPVFPSP